MKCLRLLVILSFFGMKANGQYLDTIKYSLAQKPKLFVSLASHNTFIDKQYAGIFGVRAGLNYNQRLRFGIGYFSLNNNSVVSEIHFQENELEYTTAAKLYMHYFSVNAEYYFFTKYPWQFTVTPFNVAYGRAKYEYVQRPQHKKIFGPSENLIFYQPEASMTFNILKWLAVGSTAGYRFTVLRSNEQTQHLNAVAFSIDVKFYIDELFKDIMETEFGDKRN
jgi:hypothetical protein